MNQQLRDMKRQLVAIFVRGRVIIIALIVLGLFGYTFLQINKSTTPEENQHLKLGITQDGEVLSKTEVDFDEEDLQRLTELAGEEPSIEPPTGEHSDNPFKAE